MFWRAKGDRFEWHKYVRTTIKLRREDRQRRIDELRDAAADALGGAGRAGVSAGAATLDRVGGALTAPIVWIGRTIASGLDGLSKLLETPLRPAGKLIERPGVLPILTLAGVLAGLLGIGRASVEGFDPIALVELGAAIAVVAFLVLPPLVTGRGVPMIAALPAQLDRLRRRVPGLSGLGVGAQRWITGGVLAVALVGGGWLGLGLVGKVTGMRLVGVPSLPALSRPPISGRATVMDGQTLRINLQQVRLSGVEAPEVDQQCGGQGKERRWKCGAAAHTALQELVRGKTVNCDPGAPDSAGVVTAVCTVDGRDVGAELVARGHAFAAQGLFSSYGRQEQDARNARLGVWRGSSERPSEYRTRLWEVARKTAPEGCPIKGHVSAGSRVYVLPWSPGYGRVKVESNRGGRWFCSEQEAQAAGWRASERS